MSERIIVTGGAGFIGSHFVDLALRQGAAVLVYDALTYAGNMENLLQASQSANYQFVQGSICSPDILQSCFDKFKPTSVVNFAAESHVDNSILGPQSFVETNVVGTFHLLQSSLKYWKQLNLTERTKFKYLQVSTDEVFGDLGEEGYFSESTAYNPHSPYSASKAGGDHLVRAWHDTYGLPTLVTNCSNNYGPRQYPEKLIPLMIVNALNGKYLPVYGNGTNIRDWIHVEDHARGVWLALSQGKIGETFCFGGRSERTNIAVVNAVCEILDRIRPKSEGTSYANQIRFVTDRLGHDWRYAIDDSHAQRTLGYERKYNSFEKGLEDTVVWYLQNAEWVENVQKRVKS